MAFLSAARQRYARFGAVGVFALAACSGQTATNVPPVSLADRPSQAETSSPARSVSPATSGPLAAARGVGAPTFPLQMAESAVTTAVGVSFTFLTAPVVNNKGGGHGLVVGPDSNFYYPGPSNNVPVVIQFQPGTGQTKRFSPSGRTMGEIGDAFAGAANGPDGNLWFGSFHCYLASMTTSGRFTAHKIGFPSSGSCEIWVGATMGTQVWFTALLGTASKSLYYVGYFDVAENREKIFKVGPIPSSDCGQTNIVEGPDGNMWFGNGSDIGSVTPTGSVNMFTSPLSCIVEVLNGPDGNIWYVGTNSGGSAFGLMNTRGDNIATILIPKGSAYVMNSGPDGNVWAAGQEGGGVGSIATNGIYKISSTNYKLSFYPFPKAEAEVQSDDIVTGPDNRLWFGTAQDGLNSDTHGLGVVVIGG